MKTVQPALEPPLYQHWCTPSNTHSGGSPVRVGGLWWVSGSGWDRRWVSRSGWLTKVGLLFGVGHTEVGLLFGVGHTEVGLPFGLGQNAE